MANNNSIKQTNSISFFKNSLLCMVVGIIIATILLLICSFILVKINKYERMYTTTAIAIQCISAFVSGKVLGKSQGHSLLIVGIFEGVLLCLAFLLISLVLFAGNTRFDSLLSSIPYIVSSSVLGSVLAGRKIK